MTDARGRLRQGIRALAAWLRPVDNHEAIETLSTDLLRLFQQMRPGERQHSLNVYRLLVTRGETDPRLLTAALLHDCGKARAPYWLWERVIVVLARHIAPKATIRWGKGEPVGWRRPFVINTQHPTWGADMVAAVGTDPLVVALIREHQTKLAHIAEAVPLDEFTRLLTLLQAADDAN
jgi:hypothetical protein